jgi:hypothetical protein
VSQNGYTSSGGLKQKSPLRIWRGLLIIVLACEDNGTDWPGIYQIKPMSLGPGHFKVTKKIFCYVLLHKDKTVKLLANQEVWRFLFVCWEVH